jgi:hypothetical protein
MASEHVIGNPHNQTLNVAVQWGMVGVILLYAMWLYHLLLFRGEGLMAWIGLMVVVVQNVFTSLFNSHLFDFMKAGCMCSASASPAERCWASGCAKRARPRRRQAMSAGMYMPDRLSAPSRRYSRYTFCQWSAA